MVTQPPVTTGSTGQSPTLAHMPPDERVALGRALAAYFGRHGQRRHLGHLRAWWRGAGPWGDAAVTRWAALARVPGYATLPLLVDARWCPRCGPYAGCWRVRTSLPDGSTRWCDACGGEWLVLEPSSASSSAASPAAVASRATASA